MIFDRIIERMSRADRQVRLDTLLAYSERLPEPPAAFRASSDLELHRVSECQTPVFLWLGLDGTNRLQLHAAVPREAPTVRGYLGLLHSRIDGADQDQLTAVPDDLLDRLGLTEALGMTRIQGLTAVLRRIKLLNASLTT